MWTTTRTILLGGLLLAACDDGGGGGGNVDANTSGGDGQLGGGDAAGTTITISGKATERGFQSGDLAGVTVAAYRNTDENTVVAMATTDGMGNYAITVPTNGVALDGFLKATKANYVDTYLYPPRPLSANFDQASVNMVTPTTLGLLDNLAGENQVMTNGLIALIVTNGTTPVMGAAATATPAGSSVRYNGTNNLPSDTATTTQADGIAYVFNVPPGQVMVTATKTGSTFHTHAVKARAGVLTTTVVVP